MDEVPASMMIQKKVRRRWLFFGRRKDGTDFDECDIDISYRVTLFDFYLHTNKTLI